MSIEERRQKASEILESLKGIPLADVREIITLQLPVQLKQIEEQLTF